MQKNILKPEELKYSVDMSDFKYDKTIQIEDTTELIFGQDRGIKAFEFGLNMDKKGYNIFFEGPTGVGKTMYVKRFLNKKAKEKEAPSDYCYVYNFDRNDEPISLKFDAGQGRVFKEEMKEVVEYLKENLKDSLADTDLKKHEKKIKSVLDEKKKEEIKKLNKKTKVHGFEIVEGPSGVFMLPIYKGKTLDKEEYEKLNPKTKLQYEARSKDVQELIYQSLVVIRGFEAEAEENIETSQEGIVDSKVDVALQEMFEKYESDKKITEYLKSVKKDIIKNASKLAVPTIKSTDPEKMKMPVESPWDNYKVNVFVDNSKADGAPVIMDLDYTFENIFGKVEYENQYGSLSTDFTKIKSGLLHRANGGYIVFQAVDLLRTPMAYELIKKMLKLEQIGIEASPTQRVPYIMQTLKPEPIDVKLKIVIIGNDRIYNALLLKDPDFQKLFKIKTEFEYDAKLNKENINKLSKFISSYIAEDNLLDFSKKAVSKIIEFASKLSGYQDKLSTNFAEIGRLMSEASIWAINDGDSKVKEEHIKEAFEERFNRVKKYDLKLLESIENNRTLIEVKKKKVGEINGLAVLGIGGVSFGKPSKITCTSYMGTGKIRNVEMDSKMSGNLHSKGVAIVGGYINEKFGQNRRINADITLTFEQMYSGVDGDSASSTEIYVILSSLSGVPINQGIAVTGSVNQKGMIQPIGGVNEKIKGFYEVCKAKGFNGKQGVIIPKQNIINLHLSEDIIGDVKKGNFTIYAVETVDEGIEILTGVKAGKQNKNGSYPEDTINYLVEEKLNHYNDVIRRQRAIDRKKDREERAKDKA